MTTEYRRMFLVGPRAGQWEDVTSEQAEIILAPPAIGGVGSIGDQLADAQQVWEKRAGGEWFVISHWSGATDGARRARYQALERLEHDQKLLRRRAGELLGGAGAAVQAAKDAIASAEQ